MNKKLEIIITSAVVIIVVIVIGARLFVLRDGAKINPTAKTSPQNISEEAKLSALKQLTKSSVIASDRLRVVNNLSDDDSNLSISEKQKILNALVGAK